MLAAGAAKAIQRVAGDVIAARDRYLLDGFRHGRDGDGNIAIGDILGRATAADSLRERLEAGAHGVRVERLILGRAENSGKKIGNELADHDIRVGHGQRPAAPVTGGAGIGARRLRTNAHARAIEAQQ